MARLEVAEIALADAQVRIATLEAERDKLLNEVEEGICRAASSAVYTDTIEAKRDELRQKVEDAEWWWFSEDNALDALIGIAKEEVWERIRAAREAPNA